MRRAAGEAIWRWPLIGWPIVGIKKECVSTSDAAQEAAKTGPACTWSKNCGVSRWESGFHNLSNEPPNSRSLYASSESLDDQTPDLRPFIGQRPAVAPSSSLFSNLAGGCIAARREICLGTWRKWSI